MSIIKNIITKSKLHQFKPEHNNITYTLLKKMRDLSSMRLVNRSTKKVRSSKNVSIFENN